MKPLIDVLKVRLVQIEEDRVLLQKRAIELDLLENAIQIVLADEYRRSAVPQQLVMPVINGNGRANVGNTVLSRFLIDVLGDGHPKCLSDLVELARTKGLSFDGKSPGRVLHQALRGMKFGGYTRKLPDGQWQLTEKAGGVGNRLT